VWGRIIGGLIEGSIQVPLGLGLGSDVTLCPIGIQGVEGESK
jgi:hypothetical protein